MKIYVMDTIIRRNHFLKKKKFITITIYHSYMLAHEKINKQKELKRKGYVESVDKKKY